MSFRENLPSEPGSRRSLPWQGELALYLLLMALAAALRFWDLGARPIHFDESLRATYSFRLAEGLGYTHDPELHGPLFFYLMAPVFRLFGSSEFLLRAIPAALGTVLVGMAWLLRPQLGRRGALVAALLLALSPVLLYFSRFGRMDILLAVWNLSLVICLWRYLEGGKTRYLFLSAFFLALAFSTKELAYVQVTIIGSFLFFLTARQFLARRGRRMEVFSRYLPASYLVFLIALLLPLAAPLVNRPVRLAGGDLQDHVYIAGAVVLSLLVLGAALGLRWRPRVWLFSACLFYFIYALLFTSLFTHGQGLATGIWGSLDYWLGRELARQPWYYHLMVLGVYEFLPLLFGLAAAAYYTLKGPLFGRFLAYWAVLGLALHSLMGVKMPWHSAHLVLPLILLTARFSGEVLLPRVDLRRVRGWGYGALVIVLLGLLALSVRTGWRASFPNQARPVEMLVWSQGTPALVEAARAVDEVARQASPGERFLVSVDQSLHGGWPWHWYLRNYQVELLDFDNITDPPQGSVLILGIWSQEKARPYLEKYGPEQRLEMITWFPERYRDLTPARFFQGLARGETWRRAWRYFMYRDIETVPMAGDVLLYFPPDFTPPDLSSGAGGSSRGP